MENPVHTVLVVGGGEDVRNDQLSSTCNDHGIVAEIGVFEENTGVFFVDADSVLDGGGISCSVDEGSVLDLS